MDTTSWTYSIQSIAAYQPEIVITHRDKQTRTVTDRDRQTNGQQQTKTVRQRKTDKTDRQTNQTDRQKQAETDKTDRYTKTGRNRQRQTVTVIHRNIIAVIIRTNCQ